MNYLVSFPRSGQGLTKRLLQDVYQHHGWEFSYCLYYLCCEQSPCKKGSLFQKQHDFDLSLELSAGDKYVALYRQDMITQLEAFFRWTKRNEDITFDYTNEALRDELAAFIRKKRDYYQRFLDKWVRRERAVAIEYDDYVQNPTDAIVQMLKVFRPDEDVSRDRIHSIVENRGEKVEFKNRLNEEMRQRIQEAVDASPGSRRTPVLDRWLGRRRSKAA